MMNKMSFRYKNGKYVISKGGGVYIALTEDQLFDMRDLTHAIITGHAEPYREKDARNPRD